MKGLMFYDAQLDGQDRYCNNCGRKITEKAWVYRVDYIRLFFCGDTRRCRDEFLELNSLEDVEEENEHPRRFNH